MYFESFITLLKHSNCGAIVKYFYSGITWPELATWTCMTQDWNFHKSCREDGE